MDTISQLKKELEEAVLCGDVEKADEISDKLFSLQGGMEADSAMPDQFIEKIRERSIQKSGGQKSMNVKKIISIVAIAAVTATLGITALATRWYGVRDMVFNTDDKIAVPKNTSVPTSSSDIAVSNEDIVNEKVDLIALQGYPDSNEYKANAEWNLFCNGYDTDQSLLNQVGNGSNEFTERYPMYLVYTKEMADKLEEIIKKYKLSLHTSITIVANVEELKKQANVGDFVGNSNTVLGGYVYNDGTFQFDGEAVLKDNKRINYQFGNYVKGTFSATYLNIGNSNNYSEWSYKTSSGVQVSLALGESKALVIADLERSYTVINVLSGTGEGGFPFSETISAEALQEFADSFDYSEIK
ncbi:MAG: hypothetical protein BWY74_02202 [Firmicutes bacterium ADurb.Bin419]|nr:MAG: hypothetical protein BWY74_02202 [Firmicutes bacterium ADurb.Bin419]